jgi:dTDP-4-dehydrorhamnose reductase
MTGTQGYLVVGADSLVGGGLLRALAGRNHKVIASTRRRDTLNARRVYLDFENETPFRMPAGYNYAFIVAAATNYERCEKDPLAHRINVELMPRLVTSLLEQEVFVTFISTNSVFGGERPWPREDDPHAPGIAYARQKSAAEKAIRTAIHGSAAENRFNIVRLTKILARDTSPLPNWFAAWDRGDVVQPFSDLIFAPMSVRFVGEALAALGEQRIPGNLHLSGAENVSYVDLAHGLARRLGIGSQLITPATAKEKGVNIPFMPRFSGLGMQRTTELSGVRPQPLGEVVNDLVSQSIH